MLYRLLNILFRKLIPEIVVEFEKQPLHTMPLGLGISCKVCLLSGDLHFDVLIIGLF